MFSENLDIQFKKKSSLLCVGLDPNFEELKKASFNGDIYDYNKIIIEATSKFAISFKPQVAYYSAFGLENELSKTVSYIKKYHPSIPVILDAKRGDIGTTSEMYAKESFERFGVDAVTVNPYMGADCINSFTNYKDKGVIILARTSNNGAKIQDYEINGLPLYRHFINNIMDTIGSSPNIAFVVGANCSNALHNMSTQYENNWLLVPGVGVQGASIQDIFKYLNRRIPRVLINVSRGLSLYDADEKNIFNHAYERAEYFTNQIRDFL